MLTVRSVRDRISAQISGALGPDGWSESGFPPDLFPYDSRALAHLAFVVGVPSTTPAQLDRQSARGGTTKATLATTLVTVRWAHRLRADGVPQDYGDALDAEARLIACVLEVDTDPHLSVRLLRVPTRSTPADGTAFVGTVEFEVLHRLPLDGSPSST